MRTRRALVIGMIGLLTTLGAVLACERRPQPEVAKPAHADTAVAAVVARPTPATATPEPTVTTPLSSGETHRMAAETSSDLFAPKSWYVAPPPPPPPKPVAPPFPYVYSGSLRDGTSVVLFVAQGERNFIVRKGDTLGGSYRLDDINENQATFIYLPLHEKQSLAIGSHP
jgi:hypothetical protein